MAEWQLFIDESGSFSDDDDHVVVAGLLVEGADDPGFQADLRERLHEVFPLAAYPPHATEQRSIAYVAADAFREPELAARHGLADIRSRVDALGPDVLEFVKAPHGKDAYRRARAAAARIERDRPLTIRLRKLVDDQAKAVVGIARGIVSTRRTELVVAGESIGASRGEDRYLTLLENLFERVRQRFAAAPTPVKVWGHVLRRDVREAGLPRPIPLQSRHVGRAATAAGCGPSEQAFRIVSAVPSDFAPTCHPGLVLADFAANRARHALGHPSFGRNLMVVSEHLGTTFGLPVVAVGTSSAGSIPTIAASGAPRAAIREVERGAAPPPIVGVDPPWARQQAERCIEVLRAARNGGRPT